MIYHKGRWLIEPEIKALLSKLENLNKELRSDADRVLRENAELRAKVESADRQIAEYKRILKAAVDDVRYCMRSYDPCEVCALLEENGECVAADDDDCSEKYKWRHESEALALIGEDGDTNG